MHSSFYSYFGCGSIVFFAIINHYFLTSTMPNRKEKTGMRTYDIYSNDVRIGAVMAKSNKEAVNNGCSKYQLQPKKDNVTAKLQ
jgi:hypothetical protein